MKKESLLYTFTSVSGLLLLGKVLGFGKQMVFASSFGTTLDTDLIILAQSFYQNIQTPLSQTILTAFISVYIHASAKNKETGKQLAADTRKLFLSIAALMICLMLLFAPILARVIAPSYPEVVLAKLTGYIRCFSPALLMYVSVSTSTAILQANNRFGITEMNSINRSVFSIAAVVLFQYTLGPDAISVGFLAYCAWNLIFFWFVSRKYYTTANKQPWHNPHIQPLLKMIPPLFLGYSMEAINHLIDQMVVSGLVVGAVSALDYAQVLYGLVTTFSTMFCSILFARITAKIAENDHEGSARFSVQASSLLSFFFMPISVLTILFAEDIVTIIYGRGAFNQESIYLTAAALRGYGFAWVPLVFRDLFARFQYGYQTSKTPMINSSLGICLNIVLNIILSKWLQIFGITFASSIAIAVCAILNCITARKLNKFLHFGPLLNSLPWLCAGGGVCAIASQWSVGLITTNNPLLRFFVAVLVGGCAYLIIVLPYLLKFLRTMKNETFS